MKITKVIIPNGRNTVVSYEINTDNNIFVKNGVLTLDYTAMVGEPEYLLLVAEVNVKLNIIMQEYENVDETALEIEIANKLAYDEYETHWADGKQDIEFIIIAKVADVEKDIEYDPILKAMTNKLVIRGIERVLFDNDTKYKVYLKSIIPAEQPAFDYLKSVGLITVEEKLGYEQFISQ